MACDKSPLENKYDAVYLVTRVRGPVITIVHQPTGKKRVLNRDKLRLVNPDLVWDQVQPRRSRAQRTRRLSQYLEVQPGESREHELAQQADPAGEVPHGDNINDDEDAADGTAATQQQPVEDENVLETDVPPVRRSRRLAERTHRTARRSSVKRGAVLYDDEVIEAKRRCRRSSSPFYYY